MFVRVGREALCEDVTHSRGATLSTDHPRGDATVTTNGQQARGIERTRPPAGSQVRVHVHGGRCRSELQRARGILPVGAHDQPVATRVRLSDNTTTRQEEATGQLLVAIAAALLLLNALRLRSRNAPKERTHARLRASFSSSILVVVVIYTYFIVRPLPLLLLLLLLLRRRRRYCARSRVACTVNNL